MAIAPGTGQTIDGLAIGAETRRRAAEAGRPVAYQVAIELGYFWAAAAGSVPHLVPPYGDQAKCGRRVTRADRHPVRTGIAERGCRPCLAHVGVHLPPARS